MSELALCRPHPGSKFSQCADAKLTEKTKKENDDLVRKIIKNCGREDYKKQNVLLVGQSGSGKSSIVNTLLYPTIGDYLERAQPGAGNVTSKTAALKWYPNCATNSLDFKHLVEKTEVGDGHLTYERQFKGVREKLPNLFDTAGMKNMNSPETREILRLLIGGFVNPETTFASLEDYQKHGPRRLTEKYSSAKDEYKISCVVFACSCLAPIPYELIKCVREVIEEVDPDTSRKKFDCGVYVLITKCDRVKLDAGTKEETAQGQGNNYESICINSDSYHSDTPDGEDESEYITLEEFREFREKLAEAFVLKGSFKESHLPWANYNDSLPHGNVRVVNNSLELLKKLTAPLHSIRPCPPIIKPILISVVVVFMAVLFIYLGPNLGLNLSLSRMNNETDHF